MELGNFGKTLAAMAEVELEKLVEANSDKVADALAEEIKKHVPAWTDAMIDGIKPTIKPVLKAQLLGLVEKISPDV